MRRHIILACAVTLALAPRPVAAQAPSPAPLSFPPPKCWRPASAKVS